MTDKQSIGKRWENYQASKTLVFWACAACVAATVVVGFVWGGWVTGGTARDMASKAAIGARAELAAALCVSRFESAPDAAAKLASLKASDSWKRGDVIEKDGWVTVANIKEPVAGAAILCVERLMEAKLPPAKGISG